MGKYRFLMDIKIEEKRFKILSGEQHQKFFLRILDDGSLLYPTLEEYVKLDKIYNKKASDMIYANSRKYYTFEPKIIVEKITEKGRKVVMPIALATAILTGCSNDAVYVKNIAEVETNIDNEETADIGETEEVSNMTEVEKMQKEGIEIEPIAYDLNRVIKMKNQNGTYTIYVSNNDEFREYMEVKHPTYDDVREALQQKNNISDKYKLWIRQYISNAENNLEEADLVVFYYNMKRLQIEEMSPEEIKEKMNAENTGAYFDAEKGIIALPKDVSDDETLINYLDHELSHTYTQAQYVTESGDKVVRSFNINIPYTVENEDGSEVIQIEQFGTGLLEGMNTETVNILKENEMLNYIGLRDITELFMKTADLEIYDFLNYDITHIMEIMEEKKVEEFLGIVDLSDSHYYSVINGIEGTLNDPYDLINSIYELYLPDLYSDIIRDGNGEISEEYIEKKFNEDTEGAISRIVKDCPWLEEALPDVEKGKDVAYEQIQEVLEEVEQDNER